MREALLAVRAQVMEGLRLSDALRGQPKIFPELYTAMVASGETSGTPARRDGTPSPTTSKPRKKIRRKNHGRNRLSYRAQRCRLARRLDPDGQGRAQSRRAI